MGAILEVEHQEGGILLHRVDPETGARTPVLTDSVERTLITEYNQLSGQSVALLPCRELSLRWVHRNHGLFFRASDDATYLFDLDSHKLRKLAGSQFGNGIFSPDYTQIAYTRGCDLYVMNTTSGVETRLTTGGSDSLRFGYPDWVYGEELSQYQAFFWSPDGRKLAYLQFDERPVVPYVIASSQNARGTVERQRYPVTGANNPGCGSSCWILPHTSAG